MAVTRDRRAYDPGPVLPVDPGPVSPFIDRTPTPDWVHPLYGGTDPAYAAWLAGADVRAADITSSSRRRKSQTEDAYRQALVDLGYQATNGRRQIQTGMLQRGMFRSGETGRRQGEFDNVIALGGDRAKGAYNEQIGSIDDQTRSALGGLGMEGVTQVSQAMQREALAAYNAQQLAIPQAAPQQQAATPEQQQAPQPVFAPKPVAAPKPTNDRGTDSIFRSVAPKPKVAAGTTGKLVQKRAGLQ